MSYKRNYYSAIVFIQVSKNGSGYITDARKYRNIPKSRVGSFERFCRSIPGVHHVNYYDAETRDFAFQSKLT